MAEKLLTSKLFRDSYVIENIKRIIPFQIRTMRDEREWSQQQAAKELGKTQSGYARLESPGYGKLTVQTLLEIARGFDVGLLIKFVPFSRLVKEFDDVSLPALSALSISESDGKEEKALRQWTSEEEAATAIPLINNDTSSLAARVVGQIKAPWQPIVIEGSGREMTHKFQRGLFPHEVPSVPISEPPVGTEIEGDEIEISEYAVSGR